MKKINFSTVFFVAAIGVFVIKVIMVRQLDNDIFFTSYAILLSLFILSRLAFAYLYIEKKKMERLRHKDTPEEEPLILNEPAIKTPFTKMLLVKSVNRGVFDMAYSLFDWKPKVSVDTNEPKTFSEYFKAEAMKARDKIREDFRTAKYIWRKNILLSLSFYSELLLLLALPVVVFKAVIWYPFETFRLPWFFFGGLFLMACLYTLYYYMETKREEWVYGIPYILTYPFTLSYGVARLFF